ncbi:oxysterol-binding protein-related protein 1-like [Dermacentor albipictus]|uniref:oxysterol-binding protein-related protein 1-like n=1 Tax=Dermacentor albipictus TaxID=60249 RepID=UPI0031FD63E5
MTIMSVLSDDEDAGSAIELSPEEELLQAARLGSYTAVENLLNNAAAKKVAPNVDCKGTQKANLGWTPLHLACYFGHFDVAELLLEHGAYVDVINREGDTPLHKAAYTGREGLVMLLLKHNADVFIINCEGQSPRQVAKDEDIKRILAAAETADAKKKADKLFAASKEGNMKTIQCLLRGRHPPSINSVDGFGNTALHCAAYSDNKEVAVFLLQCGIDSTLRNHREQLASDLARTDEMRQILDVEPIRQLRKNVSRHEGPLLRRKRFLGPRPVWAVLDRGVLSFFRSRGDAASGMRRKRFYYLDAAQVECDPVDEAAFAVLFPEDPPERLAVPPDENDKVDRMKWVAKLKEHIEFSRHYTHQGMRASDSEEDELVPLGSIEDVLSTAQAQQQLLERGVDRAGSLHANLVPLLDAHRLGIIGPCQELLSQWHELLLMSRSVASSLSKCTLLLKQQEESRAAELARERERSRVLQESLSVLAREHHQLECTLSNPRLNHIPENESEEEFFDAFEGEASPSSDNQVPVEVEATKGDTMPEELCPSLPKEEDRGFWGRTHLPVPMFSKNDFSLWSILKQCIGKELSKITMPVVFNEPLSFLQRISENMEYSHLLVQADEATDPIDRIELVTAFAVSALASNLERLSKPFNPLLGETYELVREDVGFRMVCEQVSHHPPVSAFHAESSHFKVHGSVYPKLKFWGKSIEIKPEGHLTVELLSHGESYTWTNVNCCIHNIIVGKLWFEQYGLMEIVCQKSGLTSSLTFKQAGWFYKDLHRIEGFIFDKHKSRLRFLYGKWTDYLKAAPVAEYEEYMQTHNFRAPDQPPLGSSTSASAGASPAHTPKRMYAKLNSLTRSLTGGSQGDMPGPKSPEPCDLDDGEIPKSDSTYSLDIPNSRLLWRVTPRPEYAAQYYNFTLFAIALNEMEEGMEKELPPTDCRLRPDMRRLEAGDLDGAAAEKNRLEEKQREARKHRKKHKDIWEPRWFRHLKGAHSHDDEWEFTGKYWDRNFTSCPDIF